MPRKSAQQKPVNDNISDNTQVKDNTMSVCKAVNCSFPVMADSKYCATHHSENETLKEAQQAIKYDTDIFMMENDQLLTVTKKNSIGHLLDMSVVDGFMLVPLPNTHYFKTEVPTLSEEERNTLKEKAPYHLLQGKKGSNKLGLAIERIEQHRDHLIGAYCDVVNAIEYLENGAPRATKQKVETNTKLDMLNKMPLQALQGWAASLGLDITVDREELTKDMLLVI